MAREIGFEAPDYTTPCSREKPLPGATPVACRAHILGRWVDTASFSMYVKSTAVFLQALGIISIGTLADHAYWRKRLLVSFAAVGSLTAALFLVIPGTPRPALPVVGALITLVGNITYAGSIVCANAFLPGLAREDPAVVAARTDDDSDPEVEGGLDEADAASVVGSILRAEDGEDEALLTPAGGKYGEVLSRTMARISSTGVAIGFFSGVAMLALLSIPVVMGGGSTRSLMLAVGLSAAWWGVFTVPAALGLPGAPHHPAPQRWLGTSWRRVASMVTPTEIRLLPNLFTYLLAWIFLSDGFHTTTYTAILYASSHLHMSPAKVIVIGLVMQLVAVGSSIYAPRVQRRLGLSNLRLLVYIVIGAQVLPLYACAGLIIPVGGLRTEWEMYVAAAWFGLVSFLPLNTDFTRQLHSGALPFLLSTTTGGGVIRVPQVSRTGRPDTRESRSLPLTPRPTPPTDASSTARSTRTPVPYTPRSSRRGTSQPSSPSSRSRTSRPRSSARSSWASSRTRRVTSASGSSSSLPCSPSPSPCSCTFAYGVASRRRLRGRRGERKRSVTTVTFIEQGRYSNAS
jgi:UMF1 family MFS transporter